MSCGDQIEFQYILDSEAQLGPLTYGALRRAIKQHDRYTMIRGFVQLFPATFRPKGFKNRFKYYMNRKSRILDPEDYIREMMSMAEEKTLTFALPDDAVVTIKAGHIRKCAEKMCSDWRKGLQYIFPEAFERVRLYPDLVPGCFVVSNENIPCLIRMDERDGTWKWINLKTGKNSDWMRINDFEESLAKHGCVITSKEEACALI